MNEPPEDDRPWLADLELGVDEPGDGAGLAAVISLRDRMPVGSVGVAFARGDHVEVGRALVRELSHQGETVFTEGAWWQYRDDLGVFRELEGAKVDLVVQQYAGCRIGQKSVLKMRASDVTGIGKVAASQVHDSSFFEGAPTGITFRNCFAVVNAHTVSVAALAKENRARHCYPFNYTAGAQPEGFLAFLRSSFRGDEDAEEKIALIREFMGMTLIGEITRLQTALVLFGEGSNGKGVLFKLMAAMMPNGSVVSIPPQSMAQEYRRAMLAGKRLNLVPEMPEADIMDSEAFKSAVAGDQMEGRHIQKAPFYFTPIAGHVFSANTLPATRDQSHGFWRRIIIIGFNRIFTPAEADPFLSDSLMEELPSIVSWCLDAAPAILKSEQFTVPSSAAAAKDKWRRSANHVIDYLDEQTVALDNPLDFGTPASILYGDYREWSLRSGYKPVAKNTFGERMKKQGLPAEKRRDCNYYPVRLKTRIPGTD